MSKITKQKAFELAKKEGIKFSGDYFADCSNSQAVRLTELAKESGYVKPLSASGSRSRYFYYYLYRKFVK